MIALISHNIIKIILLLVIVLATGCSGEEEYPYKISDFRPELEIYLKRLASEKSLPVKDTIAKNYVEKNATKEELLQLLNCENALLRVVSYRAIVNRDEKDYFEILLGHLNDTTKVTWWYYEDAVDDFMVSDLLIRKVEYERKLSQEQKNILVDSVLLKHSYLDVSNWMIQDIKPNEKYYSLIKERTKRPTDRCGTQLGACYALSKFKKKTDLSFLKSKFESMEHPCEDFVFKAIEENPQELYFPVLEKYFNEKVTKMKQDSYEDLKYYCRAVAAYKNEKSLKLLQQLSKKSTYPDTWYFNTNEEQIFKAIHTHKSQIYKDLYNRLLPKMDEFVISHLGKQDYREQKFW